MSQKSLNGPRRYGNKLYVAMYLPEEEHSALVELADRKGLSINQTATALLRIGFNNSELPEEEELTEIDATDTRDVPLPEDRTVSEGDSRASGDRVRPEEKVIDFREQYDALDVRG